MNINHSPLQSFRNPLQRELFAYPFEQRELKQEFCRQVASESLSLKAFKAIFPQISQTLKPQEQKKVVFEWIRQIAENPHEEYGGRCLWIQFHGDSDRLTKGLRLMRWNHTNTLYVENTSCGTTYEVIKSTLFGLMLCPKSVKVNEIDIRFKNVSLKGAIAQFKKAWKTIENNAARLINGDPSIICTYGFALQGNRKFTGHGFWVFQYLDQNNEIKYRIFQSFLFESTLKDFLDQKQLPLTHAEFMEFVQSLQQCLLSDSWTEELEAIFIHLFGTASEMETGGANYSKDSFKMIWGIRTITNIIEQFHRFEAFRSHPAFPKLKTYQKEK